MTPIPPPPDTVEPEVLNEAVEFVKERKLDGKAGTGFYGIMKEEMYRRLLDRLDDHAGNLEWRDRVEERKDALEKEGAKKVEAWEKEQLERMLAQKLSPNLYEIVSKAIKG